jgi:hypothetical protein
MTKWFVASQCELSSRNVWGTNYHLTFKNYLDIEGGEMEALESVDYDKVGFGIVFLKPMHKS